MAYQYPEEALIRQFTPWFTRSRNYTECFEDTDTSGSDPVDSAGFIQDLIVLIEFKDYVGPREVRYEGSAGGSIEKKIRTVLYNLYNNQDDRVTKSLGVLEFRREPQFILVFNRMAQDTLDLLAEMLSERRNQWCFGYELIHWRDNHGKTLLESRSRGQSHARLREIQFPDMPSTAPSRGKKMSEQECQNLLAEKGLGSLMNHLASKIVASQGRKRGSNVSNVNYSFPPDYNGAAIGLWPNKSNKEDGLLITFSPRVLSERNGTFVLEHMLPGEPGPRTGHLGGARFLRTEEEIDKFWENILP